MTKIIQKENRELYQCEECGFQYAEKEWAERCEALCKEHKSCNIEITAHAIPQEDESKQDVLKPEDIEFLTKLFYGLIGIVSSLTFFLVLYWVLRLDSAITNIVTNTYSTPLYFWPYVVLTLGAIALFGVNISLLVYRWRKFGPPKFKTEAGGGAGTLVGIAASACPVCGSTILSVIGIAGGLAAFPLQGLELKALSFGLMALPIWLTRRDLKKLECGDGTCPVPKDHRFKESDRPWLFALLAVVIALSLVSWNMLKTEPIIAKALSRGIVNPSDNTLYNANTSQTGNKLIDEVTAKVLPEQGFRSKIVFSDSMVKLAQNGVIDREKFLAIYQDRGGLPAELKDVLDRPSQGPLHLTRQNANYYVNLLWPLGLANYMSSNRESPINGKSLFNFASTGGWDLGKEENGGAYFNKFKIVELTLEQEALVTKIAQNAYRPCCNNSTFYQDCNHGSALLGLLQLGAAQGLTEDELYREALAFNSFWFPHNYIQTALYFKAVKNTDWDTVNPRVVVGKDFSSASGWYANVDSEIKKLGLVPQDRSGSNCGV
ncbi:MAG: US12 family protein [Candidatus Sungbacteria bacterium]|nr:US12 family protein [Candidatus Sungbacteria bacterium]